MLHSFPAVMVVTFLQWEYGSCLGFGFDNAFGQVTMQSDADKDSVLLYFPHNPVISMNNILLKQSLMTRYLLYPILVLKVFLGGVMFDFLIFFSPRKQNNDRLPMPPAESQNNSSGFLLFLVVYRLDKCSWLGIKTHFSFELFDKGLRMTCLFASYYHYMET